MRFAGIKRGLKVQPAFVGSQEQGFLPLGVFYLEFPISPGKKGRQGDVDVSKCLPGE
jgi:hypothetical protein